LLTKTKGRVLRSDIGLVPDAHRPAGVKKADWDSARAELTAAMGPSETPFIDFTVS
jgi:hypothetical protein